MAVLDGRSVNEEILLTSLSQVESLVNSRPLTYVSGDVQDPEPLTPNHFILGRASPNLPTDVFPESDVSSTKKWRHAQAIASHFWRRWMKEYFPTLTERKKWNVPQRNLQVYDVVALLDPNHPRGIWKLAKVIETRSSADGIVRSAVVRTAT